MVELGVGWQRGKDTGHALASSTTAALRSLKRVLRPTSSFVVVVGSMPSKPSLDHPLPVCARIVDRSTDRSIDWD